MANRIDGGMSTQLNPFGPQWNTQKSPGEVKTVGQQMQAALFGKPPPVVLDPAKFPQLAEQLRLLNKYKKKLATMAGDDEDEYDIRLADGIIAMIDADGVVYVGAGFLQAHADAPEVLVGVLAHEIGHRPKRWRQYESQRQLGPEELAALCRHEETRADIFAGKALAEMGMAAEPMVQLLAQLETGPHPEYFPADVRAEVIRDAHAGRKYRAHARRTIFPAVDRLHSPKGHLGEY